MMTRDQKKQYIDEMSQKFEKSEAVIVTHYQGLTVSQLDDLRKKMREHGVQFKITKNRITKIALEKLSVKIYQTYLMDQRQLHYQKTR